MKDKGFFNETEDTLLSLQDVETSKERLSALSEFAVIFLLIFLLIHFVPSEEDVKLYNTWFIMFCTVRLMFTFILIFPQKVETAKSRSA